MSKYHRKSTLGKKTTLKCLNFNHKFISIFLRDLIVYLLEMLVPNFLLKFVIDFMMTSLSRLLNFLQSSLVLTSKYRNLCRVDIYRVGQKICL